MTEQQPYDVVRVRTAPERIAVAARFWGRCTTASWDSHGDELLAAVGTAGLTPVSEPRLARFDPPSTPCFLRRNEVLVDVLEDD